MKPVIIIAIVVGVVMSAVIGTVFTINEIEKQAWLERVSTGHTECAILKASGGSINEVNRCELEYLKDGQEFCKKYPDYIPEGCVMLEKSISDDSVLNKIFP
jgi:hypothetical protein